MEKIFEIFLQVVWVNFKNRILYFLLIIVLYFSYHTKELFIPSWEPRIFKKYCSVCCCCVMRTTEYISLSLDPNQSLKKPGRWRIVTSISVAYQCFLIASHAWGFISYVKSISIHPSLAWPKFRAVVCIRILLGGTKLFFPTPEKTFQTFFSSERKIEYDCFWRHNVSKSRRLTLLVPISEK